MKRISINVLFLVLYFILIVSVFSLQSTQKVTAEWPMEPSVVYPELKELSSSRESMVVAAHPLATNAGLEMLRRGGNAMDAAVAATMVMSVMQWNVSLAGGQQLTYYDAKNKKTIVINAEPNSFKEDVMPYNPERDNITGRSIRVPGSFAGFYLAQKKYGRLPWKEVLEPAIFYAENGFPLHAIGYRSMWGNYSTLTLRPGAKRMFAPDGFLPRVGDIFKQPEMAETLKKIAEQGPDYFYKGSFAEKMVTAIRDIGGKPTLEEFSSYQALELEPLSGTYKGYQIMGPPPPSTASVVIIAGMNILEHVDLKGMGHYTQSADSLQWVIETLRIIFDDARKFSGVEEFDQALAQILVSKEYAKSRYRHIKHKIEVMKRQAKEEIQIAQVLSAKSHNDYDDEEMLGTEHVSTVDKDGNVCSFTHTIYGTSFSYAGLFVGGIVLNSSGMFRSQPGGRIVTPVASMIVFTGDQPYFATGSTGGTLNTFFTILNILGWDLNFREAQEAPRLRAPGINENRVRMEHRLDEKIVKELEKRGYSFNWAGPYSMAGAQIAGIDPKTGIRYGAACPRNMAKAAGQ